MNSVSLPRFGHVMDHGADESQARQYVRDLQKRNEPAVIMRLPRLRELPQDELRILTVDDVNGDDPEASRITLAHLRHWQGKWSTEGKNKQARKLQEALWEQLAQAVGIKRKERETYDASRMQFMWYGTRDTV